MAKYTDEQIVRSLRLRESHIVPYIVKTNLPMIRHLFIEKIANDDEAEDVFQEALIIIIQKIDANELNLTVRFSTYLYAICKNLLSLKMRQHAIIDKNLYKEKVSEAFDENFSEEYDRKYQYKMYQHYFAQLGTSCQEILNMHWVETPDKEIAKKMGTTVGYVRKKKHDCKKRLIELIQLNPDQINSD